MATTIYQILCRHTHGKSQLNVTNDLGNDYNSITEFYVDPDHAIYSEDSLISDEEHKKQQEIISEASQAMNPKYDMVFAYDGCKKIANKIRTQDQYGYRIKNANLIDPNDLIYTKDGQALCRSDAFNKYFRPFSCNYGQFETELTFKNYFDNYNPFYLKDPDWKHYAVEVQPQNFTVDEGVVPLKQNINFVIGTSGVELKEYILTEPYTAYETQVVTNWRDIDVINDDAGEGLNFSVSRQVYAGHTYICKIRSYRTSSTSGNWHLTYPGGSRSGTFNVPTNTFVNYCSFIPTSNGTARFYSTGTSDDPVGCISGYDSVVERIQVPVTRYRYTKYNGVGPNDRGYNNLYQSVNYTRDDIESPVLVLGEYVDVSGPPYLIKDSYRRVEQSPWIVHSSIGSLEGALKIIKKLIKVMGKENVKLVKLVSVNQFIKVK